MPRNKSEKFPGSPQLQAFMKSEALDDSEEALRERRSLLVGDVHKAYFALPYLTRCRLRAAMRAAAGLPARKQGASRGALL